MKEQRQKIYRSSSVLQPSSFSLQPSSFILALCLVMPGCVEEEEIPRETQAAITAGWTFFAVAEFDRAEAAFTQAAASAAPGSREYLLAKFGLGNACQHRKPTAKTEEAKKLYAELTRQDKGGDIGAWSALALVRIDHLKLYDVERPGGATETTTGEYLFVAIIILAVAIGMAIAFWLKKNYRVAGLVVLIAVLVGGIRLADWAKAKVTASGGPAKAVANLPQEEELVPIREKYQRVMDAFPKTQAAEEAAVFYGETMIELLTEERVRQGIEYLKKWVTEHPGSLCLSAAYGQMANAYEMLDQRKEQLEALIKSDDNNKSEFSDRTGTYFRIATVAERYAEQPDIAKKYYQLFLKKYPTDQRVFWCKRGLKRLEAVGQAVSLPSPSQAGQPAPLDPSRDRKAAENSRLLTQAAESLTATGAKP